MEAAGAAGTGTGYELARELRFRARREGARLLMAHMDPLDLALADGVGDAVKRVADDAVAPLYAGCLQCFDQYVGTAYSLCDLVCCWILLRPMCHDAPAPRGTLPLRRVGRCDAATSGETQFGCL